MQSLALSDESGRLRNQASTDNVSFQLSTRPADTGPRPGNQRLNERYRQIRWFQYQGNFRASRQNRFRTRLDQLERNFTDDGPRMTGRHAGLDAFATINGLHHARLIRIRRQKHLNAGRLKNIMHDTRLDRPMSGQQTNRFNIRLGAAQVIQRRVQQMDQWQTDLRRDLWPEAMRRDARHDQKIRARRRQRRRAARQPRNGTLATAQKGRRPVRDLGTTPEKRRDMTLVHRCRRITHQQFKEAHRGFRPHAAEDADRLHARTIPGCLRRASLR